MTDVREFYNDYAKRQEDTGINDRHRSIDRWLTEFGLQPDHQVLEIGCGIGTQTEIMAQRLTNGHITAVDISPKSIERAKERLAHQSNITWIAADFLELDLEGEFHVVVLPDVIEHIPISQHADLFAKLASLLRPEGFILIHIPNPNFLAWCHEHKPEALQVIDQPIYTDQLARDVYPAGLHIHFLQTYSIWYDNHDYQVVVLRKTRDLDYAQIQPETTLWSRLRHKAKSLF